MLTFVFLQLLLIGDSGVGKSCLLLRFAVSWGYDGQSSRCEGLCGPLILSLHHLLPHHH